MRGLIALLLTAALASPALAEIVRPNDFEAMSRGRTLHFTLAGRLFGSEQYFPGQRSLWRFADGTCQSGTWRPDGDAVCFLYEDDPEAQCWRFVRQGDQLSAERIEDGQATGFVLDLAASDEAPLPCLGPDIGA